MSRVCGKYAGMAVKMGGFDYLGGIGYNVL
jgi:hypothetical protein